MHLVHAWHLVEVLSNMVDTRSLVLSAIEVKELSGGWPDPMVEDYLSKLEGIVSVTQDLQESIDALTDLIAVSAADNSRINKLRSKITQISRLFVYAGYGGVGVDSPAAVSDIDATWQTLIGFDTDLFQTPRNITQDAANNGFRVQAIGSWQANVKITLSFTGENFGRRIQIRGYNATSGLSLGSEYTFFCGRNQDGINISVSLPFDVEAGDLGDLIQLQIASSTDTFAGVTNEGTVFQATHISEAIF